MVRKTTKTILALLGTSIVLLWLVGAFMPTKNKQPRQFFSIESDDGLGMEVTLENSTDRLAITTLINAWGHLRDRGKWEDLRKTFWEGGTISLSWYDGIFEGFVKASQALSDRGNAPVHLIYAPYITINGNHAIAETSATLIARDKLNGIEMDLTSNIRFYDFLEKRGDKWKIQRRVGIYESDRIDPVSPSILFYLNSLFIEASAKLKQFPTSSKSLAFLLSKKNISLKDNLVEDKTQAMQDLYQEGKLWLINK